MLNLTDVNSINNNNLTSALLCDNYILNCFLINCTNSCSNNIIMNTTTNLLFDPLINSNINNSLIQHVNSTQLPPNLMFNDNSLTAVIVYSLLFVMAAVGNLTVFISLFRSRHRKSRINLMITHLAVADLMVTFIMIPLEIGWRITVQWMAGNVACKIFLFLRAFGLYLSSNVLVCISIDRYFAVLHPLRVNDARRRGKVMLCIAWSFSLLYALPQSMVFHVQRHPKYPAFQQCVTFGFFSSRAQEVAYNLFCVLAMYFIPLLIISSAYLTILCEIWKKSRESRIGGEYRAKSGQVHLRRSDISNIERARTRTLRMTATIVAAFVFCWTPYVVMTLWYMFDRESAMRVDSRLQDALFMMAVSNSCMNPLVYGSYAMNFRRECCNFLCCADKVQPPTRYNTSVGSGVTRTTGTLQVAATRNTPQSAVVVTVPKKIMEQPDYELTSFISEPINSPIRPMFHSDPIAGANVTCYFPDQQATSRSLDC